VRLPQLAQQRRTVGLLKPKNAYRGGFFFAVEIAARLTRLRSCWSALLNLPDEMSKVANSTGIQRDRPTASGILALLVNGDTAPDSVVTAPAFAGVA